VNSRSVAFSRDRATRASNTGGDLAGKERRQLRCCRSAELRPTCMKEATTRLCRLDLRQPGRGIGDRHVDRASQKALTCGCQRCLGWPHRRSEPQNQLPLPDGQEHPLMADLRPPRAAAMRPRLIRESTTAAVAGLLESGPRSQSQIGSGAAVSNDVACQPCVAATFGRWAMKGVSVGVTEPSAGLPGRKALGSSHTFDSLHPLQATGQTRL
jgi:hypothetical protein